MKLKCKCPKCGHEFIRPPFDRNEYQKEYMRNKKKKTKKAK
jgi:hypothetical protein